MIAAPVRPRLTKSLRCPLCNSGPESWDLNAATLGSGPFEKDLFSIYRCRHCQIGITDPLPTEDESRLLYEERTSSVFQVGDSPLPSALKDAAADKKGANQ